MWARAFRIALRITTRATRCANCDLKQEPRELLRHVRGLELVEMPYSEECCGFGGTFATKFPMISVGDGRNQSGECGSSGRGIRHLDRSELPDAH